MREGVSRGRGIWRFFLLQMVFFSLCPSFFWLPEVTQKILDRDPAEEMARAFKLFDDDETGRISLKNLRRVARELVRARGAAGGSSDTGALVEDTRF